MKEMIQNAVDAIRAVAGARPSVGLILGSGLGGLSDVLEDASFVEYASIPGFPVSTAPGHAGRFVLGRLAGHGVVCMQGRFHFYEGHPMSHIAAPVRVMKALGVETLLVTNACGGVNLDFQVGDLMVITDHINLMPNPLIGPNIAELGPRFPDMHNCYDKSLIAAATKIAEEENIKLQYGVYVGGTGPTFETQAEYRYFKAIGGDAAGMSTVPEVIVARHMSIPVFGVSVITNCGLSDEVGDHEDVQRQGKKAGVRMEVLFRKMIKNLQ